VKTYVAAQSEELTGEEDRYSHSDLSDFQANLDGARTAFRLLQPVLAKRGAADLGDTIAERFDAVQRTLDHYRRPAEPSGFATYSALTAADRRQLAQAIDALAEPLSQVAARIAS
jgi:iron uptake system component EfeO